MLATKADATRPFDQRCPSIRGFTLLELLIAVGIVAVLLALLGATIGGVWEVAIDVQCKHNLSQLHTGLHMGRDVAFPSPLYWVGFVESVGCAESLICPKGDTSRPDPAAPPPRNPLPGNQADDAPLPPLPPDEPCPEQDIEPVRAPASVMIGQNGALESSTMIRVFSEQKDYVLPSNVQVNINGPGYYGTLASMTPGSVAAGTRINCYFIHFDPVGSGGAQVSGRMNFGGDILGIVCLDAQLNATDSVLGNPGTQYPTGKQSRGFESNGQEIVSVSSDRRTLTIHRFYSTGCGEQARVIVQAKAKDEPGGGGGGGGSGGPGSYWAWDGDSEGDVGGPTSYAMNAHATSSDAWPGQVLLVEYRRTIVDLSWGGTTNREALFANLAPRHDGRSNVLFVDGHIESLTPEELLPAANGEPWVGSHGWQKAP